MSFTALASIRRGDCSQVLDASTARREPCAGGIGAHAACLDRVAIVLPVRSPVIAPSLSIFARLPVPGQVKTRLIPALGKEGAARLYARLLAQTVAVARESGLDFELRVTGGEIAAFRELFGTDIAIVDQGEGDLGERMARVEAPAILVGSDCPGLTAPLLQAAAAALDDRRVVIGPANDGGYYLIGFSEPMPFLFEDVEWSTPSVLPETLARLAARRIGPAVLPELADIDTPEDLAQWPEFE